MPEEQRTQRHGPLAELARLQYGVVATRQLAALGYSAGAVSDAAAAGRLHRVHRGVYAVGHRLIDDYGRCLAAVLHCSPGALLSHGSAAWLWGLYRYPPNRIDVTAPTRRHSKRTIAVHYARLTRADIAEHEGIPVTSVARTLLDQAAAVSDERLGRLLERAEELELFDLGAVDELLGRAGRHPGIRRLKRGLAIYRDNAAFVRSRTEKRFLDLVEKAGLPRPATNVYVSGFELDAYWDRERFAVEIDAFETHGTRGAFERDRIREDDLQLLGIEMIRVTGARMGREPAAVARRVGDHLARRRRELGLARGG
jgi:very-short-patch-repair endonuclease